MSMMIAGLLLFTGTHLFLPLASDCVEGLRRRFGPLVVKAGVSILSLAGLTLIVLGWKSTQPQWLYLPPTGLRHIATTLIVVAIYLFVVAQRPSRIKRVLRHPQLTGVLLWAIGHLMLNGDSRSLLLFGVLALWAVLEIMLLNARDGAWVRAEAPPLATDVFTAVVAVAVVAGLIWAHPWFTGMAVLPG